MNFHWKIIAIALLVLFIAENILFGWALWSVSQDEKKTKICYYDICSNYVDADYMDNVCFCYERDVLGNLIVSKTEYMK